MPFFRPEQPEKPSLKKRLTDLPVSIADMQFPVEIKAILPEVYEKSKANWEKFCKVMEDRLDFFQPQEREFAFLSFVLLGSGIFVYEWLESLRQQYGSFPHYSGKKISLVFSPKLPKFRETFWHMWSEHWCCDPIMFDPLLDTLLKGK